MVAAKLILLVEDDPDDAELALRALRKARVINPVEVVTDGETALRVLQTRRPLPVLLLLDLKLPKVSGYEVLNRLEADGLLKQLAVIVVTSSKRQMDLVEGYSLGIHTFLRKPVDAPRLAEAVSRLGVSWLLVEKH